MHYFISSIDPASKFIDITLTIDNISDDTLELHLPSWRPGRYELGNFAKNIQKWVVLDSNGKSLPFHKTNKDTWLIETTGVSKLTVNYNYYAVQADAGGCWTDHQLLYINPIHLCLYVDDRMHLPCQLQLDIPADWETATGLASIGNHLFQAEDFHELVDCPLMASPVLQHRSYKLDKTEFTIWLSGTSKPDWNKIITDFALFTKVQLEMMKSFPASNYHFLILLLPYKFYHGVEHKNSTVLALGPGFRLMENEFYTDLLGVASHELFHAWNIKTIRPAEMLPYNYTRENYSTLGWVYEGFTTYYGDLFLARSHVFNLKQYLIELNLRLQKHMDNYGRFNLSVAESSFDTWLDGYVPGIPFRKTSIYDEGCLIALMLDLFIRKNSDWKHSLDDLIISLFNDFALKNRGYKEHDIKALVENFSGRNAEMIFDNYINGRTAYESYLQELLYEVGCYISIQPTKNIAERKFGFKAIGDGTITKVIQVAPSSPSEKSGLIKDDELICVNEMKVENNLQELLAFFNEEELVIEVFTQKRKRQIRLNATDAEFYAHYKIDLLTDANVAQKKKFKSWCGLDHNSLNSM